MNRSNHLLLAYYGDDFTGSTDALEFLSRAGAKTVLFIEPPTPEQLKNYHGLTAIGVAGITRSLPPAQMEEVLRPAFQALSNLGVAHVHYKVCSTFDSSPSLGSIGRAIDVGAAVFTARFVPLLIAAPALGRYCAFGNLFARMGIGSQGEIYRLDRHPSMSKHPSTPSDESDLLLHLSKQTVKQTGLMNILEICLKENEARQVLKNLINGGAEVVLFDAIYKEQMAAIGALIDSYANDKTLFSVGSSGIEMALGNYWTKKGLLKAVHNWDEPGKAAPLLVASGSCSPVTSAQIAWSLLNGFKEVLLDIKGIAENKDYSPIVEKHASEIIELINQEVSVVFHTGCGNDAETEALAFNTAESFGTVLGLVVKKVAERVTLKRVVIAGGDTSGFAARAMGIESVEMIAPLSPGAPLCRAHAPGSSVNGLEVNFKGGQVGSEDYFGMVKEGKYL